MAWVAWGSYIGTDMSHSVDLEREHEREHTIKGFPPSKPPVGCRLAASCICPCRMHSVLSFSAQSMISIEVPTHMMCSSCTTQCPPHPIGPHL
jgi:hypothetical protein